MDRSTEISKLAYEEGLRGLSEQRHALESIRGRAAANIAIVSLATSFLGPEVLNTAQQSFLAIAFLVGAAICFIISIALSVIVLRSGTGWIFSQSPGQILRDYHENNTDLPIDEVYGKLATFLDESLGENEGRLRSRLRKLNAAFVLTTIQVFIAVLMIGIASWSK